MQSYFFFYGYGAHRDLHSFPTRRSSDLRRRRSSTPPSAPARGWRDRFRCRPRRTSGRQRKDRKSTRLNSSHVSISYAVFCLKKKNNFGVERVLLGERKSKSTTSIGERPI